MRYSAKWSSKFYISLEKEREDRSTAPLGVESTAGDRTAGLRRDQPSTDYDQHAHEALQRCSTARSVRAATSVKSKVKYPDIAVRSLTYHTATGTHMPYRITQCYLPPDRGDIPTFTRAEAGTRLSDPGGMQGCRFVRMLCKNTSNMRMPSRKAQTCLGSEIFAEKLQSDVSERFLQETRWSKHEHSVQQRWKVTLQHHYCSHCCRPR